MMIKPGSVYRHFKGNLYVVIAVATMEDTGEPCVVYQSFEKTDGENVIWCRKLSNFEEKLPIRDDNVTHQKRRFEKVN